MIKQHAQKGATLIIILMILLMITVVGTYAVKQGLISLNISTNSQAQQLLIQNSDAALFALEDPNQIKRQLYADGMFGYFYSADHALDELTFCYKGSISSYSLANASAIGADGSTGKIGTAGYCTMTAFSTARSAVLSQVYIRKNQTTTSATAAPFASVSQGTSLGGGSDQFSSLNISVTVISVLPSIVNASSTDIQNCFKQSSSNVASCFKGLGVPYNIQRADYTVGTSITSVA